MNSEALIYLSQASVAQEEHLIVQDINLEVFPGELVYLIGKTGSGKSSLLRALYGDVPLKSGNGMVCGHDLQKIDRKNVHELRRDLGIVFQDFALLQDRTAQDNLDFVLGATGWSAGAARQSRIKSCLEAVGLGTKGYKMPHALSGGEQQRLAIARALLHEPPLIVADEPTGNLDPETTDGIMQLLHDLVRNDRSVIMATHDHLSFNRFPGRVLICENGRIHERDSVPTS